MPQLTNKNMVVIGSSGGAGRRIVEAGIRDGARVLAVARQEAPLPATRPRASIYALDPGGNQRRMAGTSPAMTIQTNLILLESSKPFLTAR